MVSHIGLISIVKNPFIGLVSHDDQHKSANKINIKLPIKLKHIESYR